MYAPNNSLLSGQMHQKFPTYFTFAVPVLDSRVQVVVYLPDVAPAEDEAPVLEPE